MGLEEVKQMDDKYIKFLLTVVVAVLVWSTIMLTVTAFYQMAR